MNDKNDMTNSELNKLIDSRFNYTRDNPFGKNHIEKFKDITSSNPNSFRDVDWISDSRISKIKRFMNGSVFNKPVTESLEDNDRLCYFVCSCLNNINNQFDSSNKLNNDLMNYVQSHLTIPIESIDNTVDNDVESNQDDNVEDENQSIDSELTSSLTSGLTSTTLNDQFNSSVESRQLTNQHLNQIDSSKDIIYKSNDELTTYNISEGRKISFNELCQLTVQLARTQLSIYTVKDENTIYIEEREKAKLRSEIRNYQKNIDINNRYCDIDVNKLNLKQLQDTIVGMKDYYEQLKIIDVMKKGIELGGLAYDTVFPNGIKIPGTHKKLEMNGTGDAIKRTLFDRDSPVQIAFINLQKKYNWKISDEMLLGLNIFKSIIGNIKLVDQEENENENDLVEQYSSNSIDIDNDNESNSDESQSQSQSPLLIESSTRILNSNLSELESNQDSETSESEVENQINSTSNESESNGSIVD